MPLMGIREYARYRGVRHFSVQTAIAAGRIQVAKTITKGTRVFPLIDSDAADRDWRNNTDESMIKTPKNESPHTKIQSGSVLNTARSLKETYKAKLMELDFKKKSGDLVEVKAVEKIFFEKAQTTSQRMLNIADRVSPILAAETNPKAVHDILTHEIRVALTELADGAISV
jgi:hypothetical protein